MKEAAKGLAEIAAEYNLLAGAIEASSLRRVIEQRNFGTKLRD